MTFETVHELVNRVLDEEGIELVELQIKGRPGRELIRVYVFAETGITVDRCAQLSRKISDLFDRKNVFSGNYTLEVSSPGTDRPLKTIRDFERNIRRTISCDYESKDGRKNIVGVLIRVTSQTIELDTEGVITTIAISTIHKAQIKLKW